MTSHSYKIGDSRVLESRESADGITIRRRRETIDGKHRFTTYERIERPNLAVIKRDGSRELFDHTKLLNSTTRSVGKFFKSDVEIEGIINTVEEKRGAISDSRSIRTTGLQARVTMYTTIWGAEAAAEGIKNCSELVVYPIQTLHTQLH